MTILCEKTDIHKNKSISHFEDEHGNHLEDLVMCEEVVIVFKDKSRIRLTVDHRGCDASGWTIQRRRINEKGVERWDTLAYYGSIGQAAKALADRMLREADTTTLDEAIAEMERVSQTLSDALTGKLTISVS